MMPERIQRKRTKGWRMPEGAVYVGRPTRWGNPFPAFGDWAVWTAVALGYRADTAGRRAMAVALYEAWMLGKPLEPLPVDDDSGGAIEFSDGRVVSVAQHARDLAMFATRLFDAPSIPHPPTVNGELAGKDLACYCPLDQPCHADVLLRIANESA